MVANSQQSPRKPRLGGDGPRLPVPILTKLKARNMFLTQAATHEAIAAATGLTTKAVGNLVSREGWAKQRREMLAQTRKRLDAQVSEQLSEISDTLANESEEIALAGLDRARKGAASKGKFAARDFQSWTGGVRNLVQIARQCRGLDGNGTSGPEQPQINLNVFVSKFGPAADEARPVERVVQPVPALPA